MFQPWSFVHQQLYAAKEILEQQEKTITEVLHEAEVNQL